VCPHFHGAKASEAARQEAERAGIPVATLRAPAKAPAGKSGGADGPQIKARRRVAR